MGSVLLGAIVIAGLTTLSGWASTTDLPLTLYWPAAGIGFAMLCTQGKSAAWALGLGVSALMGNSLRLTEANGTVQQTNAAYLFNVNTNDSATVVRLSDKRSIFNNKKNDNYDTVLSPDY
jgi:hypothetical protein